MSVPWASSLLQDRGERKRGNRNPQSVFLEAGTCVMSSFGCMRQMGDAGFHQQSRVMERSWKSWALVMGYCLFSEPKTSQVAPGMYRLRQLFDLLIHTCSSGSLNLGDTNTVDVPWEGKPVQILGVYWAECWEVQLWGIFRHGAGGRRETHSGSCCLSMEFLCLLPFSVRSPCSETVRRYNLELLRSLSPPYW